MKSIKHLGSLRGRYCLITGACGHLGKTFAEALAEIGANLILVDLPDSDFSFSTDIANRENVSVITKYCNLEETSDRDELISTINQFDHELNSLINNAAFTGSSNLDGWIDDFENQTLSTWNRAIEVNLTSCFHLCQGFANKLKNSKGGNIINIASIYGELGPDWGLYKDTKMGNPAGYASSKGGLIQLTKWLATTLAPHVRVNAITPGGIYRSQDPIFVDRYIAKTPMNRMATEEDFKGVVSFLASDLSAYVTGQNVRVDGGWSSW